MQPATEWCYDPDHVCRPVLVDAEGRKRPIIALVPQNPGSYVATKTETLVQHQRVALPSGFEYNYGHVMPSDQLEGYGVADDKWHRPPSSYGDPPENVQDFLDKVQTEASGPRFSPFGSVHWRQPPGSTDDLNKKERQKPSVNTHRNKSFDDDSRKYGSVMEPDMVSNGTLARPNQATWSSRAESHLSKPVNAYGRGMNYDAGWAKPSQASWSSPPESPRSKPVNAYGGGMNYDAGWAKPSQASWSSPPEPPLPKPVNAYGGGMNSDAGWAKPSQASWSSPPEPPLPKPVKAYGGGMNSDAGRAKPSQASWSSPPSHAAPLSTPTSDIGAAMQLLKEAARPVTTTAQYPPYTKPAHTETIDSKEAARRYGNFNDASRPYAREDSSTTTIDSREAARKYGGTIV